MGLTLGTAANPKGREKVRQELTAPIADASAATIGDRDLGLTAFRQLGYVICNWPLFEQAKLVRLRSIAKAYAVEAAAGIRSADLNQPHFDDPRLFEFLLDARPLDIAERLLGSDLLLWSSQFFCKPALTGRSVPWHDDAHYWRRFIDPVRVVSIFVALNDTDSSNGCLRVLAGSHVRSFEPRYRRSPAKANPFFPFSIPEQTLDPTRIVDVQLRAGEFVVFDSRTLHGSNANTSQHDRFCFTMRYAPTTCHVDSIGLQPLWRIKRSAVGVVRRMLRGRDIYRHKIYLVRGRDHAGNRYEPLP